MKAKPSSHPKSRAVGDRASICRQTTPSIEALPSERAAKVNRLRAALDRGQYPHERAVDLTVDRVIADLCRKQR